MLLKYIVILIMPHQWFLLCDTADNAANKFLTNSVNDKKTVCIDPMKLRRNEDKQPNNSSNNPADENSNNQKLTKNTPLNSTILGLRPNATANREEIKGHKGRYLTKHFAFTCDGYILTILHLTFEDVVSPSKNRPVLLVPGMFQSSDKFLQQSPEQSLAFKLQDLGYDVWLANVRGTKYSRKHVYLEADDEIEKHDFFNYSFEEIGYYDIAATVDTIRHRTVFKKMHYIGHSSGATAFLVLNSLKPDYNVYFDMAFLMAPLAFQRYFPHYGLKRDLYDLELQEDLVKAGIVEIFPLNSTENQNFLPENCFGKKKYQHICKDLDIAKMMNLNTDINTKENTRGGSIKQLIHLAQNVHSGSFRRWQYKEEKENIEKYGQKSPPEYNLSLVTVPTVIYHSTGDEFVSRRDIKLLAKKMSKATIQKVAKINFKHDDYFSAPDAMTVVYNDILSKFPENSNPIRHSDETGGITSSLIKYGPRILVVVGMVGMCVILGIHFFKSKPSAET